MQAKELPCKDVTGEDGERSGKPAPCRAFAPAAAQRGGGKSCTAVMASRDNIAL